MKLLKTSFAVLFALAALHAPVFADAVPALEKCVVNGDKFSEHRAVQTVTFNGRTIQVCCKGCVRKFNKDPEKFLKAWDEALKAKADSAKPAAAAK